MAHHHHCNDFYFDSELEGMFACDNHLLKESLQGFYPECIPPEHREDARKVIAANWHLINIKNKITMAKSPNFLDLMEDGIREDVSFEQVKKYLLVLTDGWQGEYLISDIEKREHYVTMLRDTLADLEQLKQEQAQKQSPAALRQRTDVKQADKPRLGCR